MKESSRSLAFAALKRWRNGTDFADKIVGESFARSPLASSDRAFAVELFYGVLRNLSLLDFWIAQLRSEPVDPRTRDLLRLGLYQVLLIETAAHAAVFETVELAPARVRSLVNAILRRALREKVRLTNAAEAESLSVRFSTPAFLIEKWSSHFEAAQVVKLCHWNNRPPPVYARINRLKTTAAEFLIRYPGSALLPGMQNFVRLPDPFAALENGDCYIQDPSTALACELLRPRAGESVLDACAAPGGKTIYLAEMMQNEGEIVAADLDENRLQRLRDNVRRLEVRNVRTFRCDWRDESSIQSAPFGARSFDKILLDAPCTNTGVMRRRVDLRWRLRPEDFNRMHRLQLEILRAVVPLLKPGGSLVYSTCSLEREENAEVIETFLGEERGFRLTSFEETLPFRDSLDGAFAARLELSASGS
jgi:16S rRNA (cytosine967-C5)-methyltransferase